MQFVTNINPSKHVTPVSKHVGDWPYKDEAQTALFKDPVRTAL